jgi:tetratricopeptide (TPR) repeat protein
VNEDRFRRKRAEELWTEGERLQLAGDVDRAIDRYTKSINIIPTAEAHTYLGWAYRFQNRLDDAITECKKAIHVDPSYGNPYNDIGSYLLTLGNVEEAIHWLERAKMAPRYVPRHFPYMNLGRVYAAKGHHIRALREFEGALSVCPGEPTCVAAIEFLRAKLG